VAAVKVEGRQRSPAYVRQVTEVMRAAIDECLIRPDKYSVKDSWNQTLGDLSEGQQTTLGAYYRNWQ